MVEQLKARIEKLREKVKDRLQNTNPRQLDSMEEIQEYYKDIGRLQAYNRVLQNEI